MKNLFYALLAMLAVASCREDELVAMSDTQDTGASPAPSEIVGMYVLCEGNMGTNKASVDYLDLSGQDGTVKYLFEVAGGKMVDFHGWLLPVQFAGIIPALQTNMIDVAVAAITITEERKKQVLFSDPYYDVGLAMIIKAANKDKYSELKDIEGKAICAQIGSTGSLLAQSVKGAKVMNFDQVAEALMELKMGGCEAALLGDTTARHYQSQHHDLSHLH